jgi:ABC-2 type transport system ATP-binding protein
MTITTLPVPTGPLAHPREVGPAPAVRIRDLHVRRGGRLVLDGITLSVARGAITGLLGPSGCGKSTLIRAIMGIQVIESGDVTVLGQPAGFAPLRSRIGYVTQRPALYDDLTVGQNLAYFARIAGASRHRIDEVLELVDLAAARDQRTSDMSGGQRARVSLASALLGDPELLVLDEPTVGLDPVLRLELWEAFRRLADEGTSIVVSSHVMDEAERCDDLLLLRDGALLSSGPPQALRDRTGETDLESAFLSLARAAA